MSTRMIKNSSRDCQWLTDRKRQYSLPLLRWAEEKTFEPGEQKGAAGASWGSRSTLMESSLYANLCR